MVFEWGLSNVGTCRTVLAGDPPTSASSPGGVMETGVGAEGEAVPLIGDGVWDSSSLT